MSLKLFIVLLGARTEDRNIEQHDVCFCVGETLEDLYDDIRALWLNALYLHIDAYMCVEQIRDYDVIVENRSVPTVDDIEENAKHLFFINLGGYQAGVFEEIHKKILVVASNVEKAKSIAKTDSFFSDEKLLQDEHCRPHVDDKYCIQGAACDDVIDVNNQFKKHKDVYIRLKKVREGSEIYPDIIIKGFHLI